MYMDNPNQTGFRTGVQRNGILPEAASVAAEFPKTNWVERGDTDVYRDVMKRSGNVTDADQESYADGVRHERQRVRNETHRLARIACADCVFWEDCGIRTLSEGLAGELLQPTRSSSLRTNVLKANRRGDLATLDCDVLAGKPPKDALETVPESVVIDGEALTGHDAFLAARDALAKHNKESR
jgi:hypothetical protein